MRIQGLERRRGVRHRRPLLPGHGARRHPLRHDRSRGVRRLPVHAPDGPPARRADAPHRLARVRGLRGSDPARAARPDPALRPRARDPLAHVLRAGHRPLRGARRADGHLARRAARRRPALAPGLVTGIASDESLVQRLGLSASRYEGPTGIVGVLQAAASDAGLPAASLWAAVPHYVAVVPNPKGALALLRKLETLVGVTVDATELERRAATTSARSRARSRWTPTSRPSSSASSARPTRRTPARPVRPALRRPAGSRVPAVSAAARGGSAAERQRRWAGKGAEPAGAHEGGHST